MNPVLRFDPPVVKAEEKTTLIGDLFPPRLNTRLNLFCDGTKIGSVRTDGSGSFRTDWWPSTKGRLRVSAIGGKVAAETFLEVE